MTKTTRSRQQPRVNHHPQEQQQPQQRQPQWFLSVWIFAAAVVVVQNLVSSKKAIVEDPSLFLVLFSSWNYNNNNNNMTAASTLESQTKTKTTTRDASKQPQQPPLNNTVDKNNNNNNNSLSVGVFEDPRPRGMRLLMIGDSLMRFHYLSLTHFLLHGCWIDDDQQHGPPPSSPTTTTNNSSNNNNNKKTKNRAKVKRWTFYNPMNPATFRGHTWNEFLALTTRPYYEICDCYRLDKPNFDPKTTTENRYFYEPQRDNLVILMQVLKYAQGRIDPALALQQLLSQQQQQQRPPPSSLFFHNNTLHFHTIHNNKPTQKIQWRFRKSVGYAGLIHHVVRNITTKQLPKNFQPTHVLFNQGLWEGHWFQDKIHRDNVWKAFQDYHMHGIWRTTTYWSNRKLCPFQDDTVMVSFLLEQQYRHNKSFILNVSWTKNVHRNLYWDGSHFWEPVYRVWSEQLLQFFLGHEFPTSYTPFNLTRVLETPSQQQTTTNKTKGRKQNKNKAAAAAHDNDNEKRKKTKAKKQNGRIPPVRDT